MQTTSTARDVVLSLFDAIERGDLNDVRALLAPDVTWWVSGHLPISGLHDKGLDALLDEFIVPVLGRFEPGTLQISLRNVISEGRYVAVELTGTGRLDTGVSYENNYAFMFGVDDGRIADVREYPDTLYLKESLFS